jgi:hypothetical protein
METAPNAILVNIVMAAIERIKCFLKISNNRKNRNKMKDKTTDVKAKLAMYYLNKIKLYVKPDSLNEAEHDFIYNILEREKMADGGCKLTQKEFQWLARIAQKVIEKI